MRSSESVKSEYYNVIDRHLFVSPVKVKGVNAGAEPSVKLFMRLRISLCWVAGFLSLALLGCSRGAPASKDDANARAKCQRNLKSMVIAVKTYLSDNDDQFPPSLGAALSNIAFVDINKFAKVLSCPGAAGTPTAAETSAALGYRFIDWSQSFGKTNTIPLGFPIMFDRTLSNHGGNGVNIVLLDGTLLWDENARWLREFAKKHPEYKLPLPE
jgi:hypothetical protein